MPRKKSTSTTKSSTKETKPVESKTETKSQEPSNNPKTVNVTDMQDLSNKVQDIEVFGDPGKWELLCKASSKSEGWMKSTKTMQLDNGLLVQVSTQQGDNISEAITFIPRAKVVEVKRGENTLRKIVSR